MGLDKIKRVSLTIKISKKYRFFQTPCGFCFVEYYTRLSANNALRWVNGTRLDDRIIRTDWDAGFVGKFLKFKISTSNSKSHENKIFRGKTIWAR